jgi:hypothetical protein
VSSLINEILIPKLLGHRDGSFLRKELEPKKSSSSSKQRSLKNDAYLSTDVNLKFPSRELRPCISLMGFCDFVFLGGLLGWVYTILSVVTNTIDYPMVGHYLLGFIRESVLFRKYICQVSVEFGLRGTRLGNRLPFLPPSTKIREPRSE